MQSINQNQSKTCGGCNYFRNGDYCSNSKSPNFHYKDPHWLTWVSPNSTCDQFTPKGQKAPSRMRFAIWFLGLTSKQKALFFLLIALFIGWLVSFTIGSSYVLVNGGNPWSR